MSLLETLLRRELRGFDPLALRAVREPYGPDPAVFGPGGVTGLHHVGAVVPRCPCGVSWTGPGECWACAGTGGLI